MQKSRKIVCAIWSEFVYGGHLLSLGAVSVVETAAILLGITTTWEFLLLMYLGPQSIYLFNRFKEFRSDLYTNPQRTDYISKYFKIIPILIVLYASAFIGILLYSARLQSLVLAIFFVILGFFYTIFFKKLTKYFIGFKNFFVAISWCLLIFFLIHYYSFHFNVVAWLIIVFVLLRVLVHEIVSDIKDLKSDRRNKLLVIPSLVDKKKLPNILIGLSLFSFLPLFFGIIFGLLPKKSIALFSIFIYSCYILQKLKKINDNQKKDFFYSVLVDGEFILWLPILIIASTL